MTNTQKGVIVAAGVGVAWWLTSRPAAAAPFARALPPASPPAGSTKNPLADALSKLAGALGQLGRGQTPTPAATSPTSTRPAPPIPSLDAGGGDFTVDPVFADNLNAFASGFFDQPFGWEMPERPEPIPSVSTSYEIGDIHLGAWDRWQIEQGLSDADFEAMFGAPSSYFDQHSSTSAPTSWIEAMQGSEDGF